MDGVLANFNKEYLKYDSEKNDREKFRDVVLIHRIFENLDLMPDAHELLNHVAKLKDIDIQILTSTGTNRTVQKQAAIEQKLNWLNKMNIPYHANFSMSKAEKAAWATPTSILIDDSPGCVAPFIEAGGHAILHKKSSETIRILDSYIKNLNVAYA